MPSLFITFEGGEGSGKTTQLKALLTHLRSTGRGAVETRDPGGTPIGKQIRALAVSAGGMLACVVSTEGRTRLWQTTKAL